MDTTIHHAQIQDAIIPVRVSVRGEDATRGKEKRNLGCQRLVLMDLALHKDTEFVVFLTSVFASVIDMPTVAKRIKDPAAERMRRLRAGLCPMCGISGANSTETRRSFIESDGIPQCCCEQCYDTQDLLMDTTWAFNICKDCPIRNGGPHVQG